MILKTFFLILGVYQLTFTKSFALSCYECTNCNTNIENNPTRTCSQSSEVCGVIILILLNNKYQLEILII